MRILRRFRVELDRYVGSWDVFLQVLAPYWIQDTHENHGYNSFRPYVRVPVSEAIYAIHRAHPTKWVASDVNLNVIVARILLALHNGVPIDEIMSKLRRLEYSRSSHTTGAPRVAAGGELAAPRYSSRNGPISLELRPKLPDPEPRLLKYNGKVTFSATLESIFDL